MKEMKIGIQLYSLREELKEDLAGGLLKVKEQGYEGVELAGTYGYEAGKLKELFASYGLEPVAAHIPLEELLGDQEGTLSYYQELGCKQAVIPWLGEVYRYGSDKYRETLQKIEAIGKACKAKGMTLSYHNHDFEFVKTDKGTYMLDDMYETTDPSCLHAELDTCWVQAAGVDAAAYVRKYAGRCELIHVKDFNRKDEVVLAPLGEGEVDVKGVVQAAEETSVTWLIVEQDDHYGADPFENMKKSREYLKKIYR